jgi:hypothetical protein
MISPKKALQGLNALALGDDITRHFLAENSIRVFKLSA